MARPILDERVTIRIPGVLLSDYLDRAARRNSSLNDVILNALELDAARVLTYQIDYYTQLRPLQEKPQGDNGVHCLPLSDSVRKHQ